MFQQWQMKDICMIAYLKINVPTVQMRELSMIFHIRIWVHRAGERNMRVSFTREVYVPTVQVRGEICVIAYRRTYMSSQCM